MSQNRFIHSLTYSTTIKDQFCAKYTLGAGGATLIFTGVSWSTAPGSMWLPWGLSLSGGSASLGSMSLPALPTAAHGVPLPDACRGPLHTLSAAPPPAH